MDLLSHHHAEILRLKKGKNLSEYDKEHKNELIAFLDDEVKQFKINTRLKDNK